MKRRDLSRSSKLSFAIWLVLALALTAVMGFVFWRGLPVESDLMAMLPQDTRTPEIARAITVFQNRLGEHTVVLVGVPASTEDLNPAVESVCAVLRESKAFAEVTCSRAIDATKTFELISSHRWQLLSPDAAAQLQKGDAASFFEEAQAQIFGPTGSGRAALLTRDPFGLSTAFLMNLQRPGVSVDAESGIAWVEGEGRRWAVIDARNQDGAFHDSGPTAVVAAYGAAKAKAGPQVELLGMGIAFHAAAASKVAKQEISTIGIGSWVGSILLVIFVFRSVRTLLLSTLVIAIGMEAGLLATIAVFGRVHVLTMVLGSSLAGVAIDYALHVLSDSFHDLEKWEPAAAVKRLRWPLFLGMATSVASYASLAITPFPGLRQLALFATVALTTALATVVLSFPVLLHGYRAWGSKPPELAYKALLGVDAVLANRRFVVISAILFVVICAVGLLRLRAEDDIHTFQNPDPQVTAAETRGRALFGEIPESQYYLVTGQSAEAVLQSEQALAPKLEALHSQGALTSFQMVSQHVPPAAIQKRNVELMSKQVYASPALAQYFDALGLNAKHTADDRAGFDGAQTNILTVDEWLASAPGEGDRTQWLGEVMPGAFASVVFLNGLTAPLSALTSLQNAQITFVDRVSEISSLMGNSRRWALGLVVAAFVLMWVLLALRYGKMGGFRTLLPTALSCVLALAVAGLLGLPLNIFSTVALWLILGMGVDYSIFFREAGDDARSTAIGVLVDSITTLLSFGLLALSHTAGLRAFGTVLSVGLAFAFLLAPLARSSAQRTHT